MNTIPLYDDYNQPPIEGKYSMIFFAVLLGLLGLSLLHFKCEHNPQFDPTTSARAAFGPITSDTTKPVKQYVYVLKISPQEWATSMDTLQGVMEKFGVDMLVRDAQQYQQLFYRQLGRLGAKMSLDSVMVKK